MSVLDKKPDGPVPVTLETIVTEVNKSLDAKVRGLFDDFKKGGLGDAIKAQLDPINSQMGTINDALAKLVAGVVAPPVTPTPGTPTSGTGDTRYSVPPEMNVKLKELGETVKNQGQVITQLQTAKENAEKRAEETDRHSTIRTSLQGLPFVNEKASETAFSIVLPHVRRLDDQSLIAEYSGDNFPVDAFVKDYLNKEHGYLFKTSGSSGSGAPSSGGGMRAGGMRADLADIKIGMKPDARQAVVDSITSVLQSA